MDAANYIVRGRRLDTGEWMIGFYLCLPINKVYRNFIIAGDCSVVGADALVEINIDTLGRCTGARDKNGVLVFEDDILSPKLLMELSINERTQYPKGIPAHRVVWGDSMYEGLPSFKAVSIDGKFYHNYMNSISDREVIGNAFDTPQLLQT